MQAESRLVVQGAAWAGGHALSLLVVILALLLAATATGWWAWRRAAAPGSMDRWRLSVSIDWRTAFGLGLMLSGALFFAALAGQLHPGQAMGQADQAFTLALRASAPPAALQAFAALTHLADTATLTALCIAVALALVVFGRRLLAVGWVAAVAGNGLLNETLKWVFGRGRPLDPDALGLAQGYSFPSGHSSGAVVAYGMLAYLALRLLPGRWHLPALLVATALAITVGASRLFLRLHFASDVAAGFASGAVWLVLCVTTLEFLRTGRRPVAR